MSPDADDEPFLRPFLVTSGRTRPAVEGLRFETLVEATALSGHDLRFEAARIHELCHTAIGVAELSANLQIPFGATRVLVSDLIGSGHLYVHDSLAKADLYTEGLVARLINGVKQL